MALAPRDRPIALRGPVSCVGVLGGIRESLAPDDEEASTEPWAEERLLVNRISSLDEIVPLDWAPPSLCVRTGIKNPPAWDGLVGWFTT